MWVKRDVVMLPTNKSNMCRIIDLEDNTFKFNIQPNQDAFIDIVDKGFHVEPFYLNILSDEKPKEGDWCLDLIDNHVFMVTDIENNYILLSSNLRMAFDIKRCKKIIATTDKSLTIKHMVIDTLGSGFENISLPQIPQSFIEYYISEYNKGNTITEVMVEYENKQKTINYHKDLWVDDWVLKINPDNTINIKPIKNSWSRKEVEDLLHLLNKDKPGNFDCGKWIEENI